MTILHFKSEIEIKTYIFCDNCGTIIITWHGTTSPGDNTLTPKIDWNAAQAAIVMAWHGMAWTWIASPPLEDLLGDVRLLVLDLALGAHHSHLATS